ncbi:anti-sigma factor [uncultured Amnibacterium sp.]|uniref:anti-sigma factor n=1 Tax=uncultured Amnibacterium sp. TaxID=1631851 RepID=UPI0035CBA0BC
MPHVDPDLLALLALGEDVGSDGERRHVDGCETCSADLRTFATAVAAGRRANALGPLHAPHPRVWQRVQQELGPQLDATSGPRRGSAVRRIGPQPSRPRRAMVIVLSVAAGLAVLAAGLVAVQRLRPPTTVASAILSPFPKWPSAEGRATVQRSADGTRTVTVTVNVTPTATRSDQVWLMTKDQHALISLGVLPGESGSFRVPPGVDLDHYDLVDVSAEPHDGDPHHSGNSIVRGPLNL